MVVTVADLPILVEALDGSGSENYAIVDYNSFIRFMDLCLSADEVALDFIWDDKFRTLDVEGEHRFIILTMLTLRQLVTASRAQGKVDERYYLDRHKDVAAAIEQGALQSATQHYLIQGYFERRATKFEWEN